MTTAPPLFHDQFVIARSSQPHPVHFKMRTAEGWWMASSPSLPVTPITRDGTQVGWLLGWAAQPDGTLVHRSEALEMTSLPETDENAFESSLYDLAGRWAALLLTDHPRLYLDPAGSLAAVFSVDQGAVASTTSVLQWGSEVFAEERFLSRTLSPNQYHPFGLTSTAGVARLLPNHYLNLATWETSRHWPVRLMTRVGSNDAAALAAEISRATESSLVAFAADLPLIMPLTAGRDSRMIMGSARRVAEKCTFVTFDYRDARKSDVTYARAIAKRFGVAHQVLPLPAATDADKMHYLQAIGYDANEGKANDFYMATQGLPLTSGWVTGFAGEVGRAYYWSDQNEGLSPRQLVTRMRLPTTVQNVEAAAAWMKAVPAQDGEEMLDLAYIEQRLGAWASPQLYGATPFALNLIVLNQRQIFRNMLELPVDYRRRQSMATDVVRAGWPELAALPFGRRPGVLGKLDAIHSRASRFRERTARRARKLMGMR